MRQAIQSTQAAAQSKHKLDKILARLAKRKRGRTQINKIINERGDIITDITELEGL